MGFWKKFFGGKRSTPRVADAHQEKELINAYDEFGREIRITRADWVHSVLEPNLKKAWSDSEKLEQLILSAVHDGFFAEVLEASSQLVSLVPDSEMATVLYAIALLKTGDDTRSEQVLTNHLNHCRPSGAVLTNLAKVHAARQDRTTALKVLWNALELDPNQDNALLWYESEIREEQGESAGAEALRRASELPGSWRAQAWLARLALQRGRLSEAEDLYRQSLSAAPAPPPSDLLMQISGDLGQAGHLKELLQIVVPRFVAPTHGLAVGNNLIKAFLDTYQVENAASVLDQLHALQRSDWKESLNFWDHALAQKRVDVESSGGAPKLDVSLLTTSCPIWLKADSPVSELFPTSTASSVVFLGGTGSQASSPSHPQMQLADTLGRICRGLPLYLAEHVSSQLSIGTSCLVPWNSGPPAGFVVSGGEWTAEDAAKFAASVGPSTKFAVAVHVTGLAEQWQVKLRISNVPEGDTLSETSIRLDPVNPGPAMLELAALLVSSLDSRVTVERHGWSHYSAPPSERLGHYLLRLEQLLCLRVAAMDGVQDTFLHGQREVLSGTVDLCLQVPKSASVRLLLAAMCTRLAKLKPEVVREQEEQLLLLEKRHPLPSDISSEVSDILHSAISTARGKSAL